jgi:putative membrane protein
MLFGGEISAFDAAFPLFLISTGAAGLMLLMASTVYVLLTPWKELSLVRSGNTAAGVALGGAIIGLAIPISSTLASSMTLPGLLIWGVIALLMQLIAYRVVDLILRDIPGRIANDEIGAATVLVAAKLSAALILAAGLWDPLLQRV